MRHQDTKRSRGFGFVSFRSEEDARKAIGKMDGLVLGSRRIRVNVATLPAVSSSSSSVPGIHHTAAKSTIAAATAITATAAGGVGVVDSTPPPFEQIYLQVLNSSPTPTVTSVHVGNLSRDTTVEDIRKLFGTIGIVQFVKLFSEKFYAFVVMHSHEAAALAIVKLQGAELLGRRIRTAWGSK